MEGSTECLDALISFGCQTADRIPTPVVHGRGGHGTVRRQCPPSRTTLRLGTRNGREGTARVSSRDALSGEFRRDEVGRVAKRRTRNWRRTSGRSSNPIPTPIRN